MYCRRRRQGKDCHDPVSRTRGEVRCDWPPGVKTLRPCLFPLLIGCPRSGSDPPPPLGGRFTCKTIPDPRSCYPENLRCRSGTCGSFLRNLWPLDTDQTIALLVQAQRPLSNLEHQKDKFWAQTCSPCFFLCGVQPPKPPRSRGAFLERNQSGTGGAGAVASSAWHRWPHALSWPSVLVP